MTMRTHVLLAGMAAGLLLQTTCSNSTPEQLTSAECVEACAYADRCGFLPSALGWNEEGDTYLARLNCESRCQQTRRGSDISTAILTCLSEEVGAQSREWCDDEGSDFHRCGYASKCLELASDTYDVKNAIGEAEILFTLLPQDVYDFYFTMDGFKSTVELQLEDPPSGITCEPALCSDEQCAITANNEGSIFCDPRLCTVSVFSTQQECNRLGVTELEVGVMRYPFCTCDDTINDGRSDQCDLVKGESCPCDPGCDPTFEPELTVIGSQHLGEVDNDQQTTSICTLASDIPIPDDIHRIDPGPAIPYIRIRGELTLEDLLAIGLDPRQDGYEPVFHSVAATDTDTDTDSDTTGPPMTGTDTDSDTSPPTTGTTEDGTGTMEPTTGGMTDSATSTGTDTGEPEELNMVFSYCWQFRGPTLLIRAGKNRVIVPLPSLKYLEDTYESNPNFAPTPCLE